MRNLISVKVGGYAVSKAPDVLETYGVGSCIVVCLYGKKLKCGGLAHMMLPSSIGMDASLENPYRFVDSGITGMVEDLVKSGVQFVELEAKLIGGAHMFKVLGATSMEIGQRNIEQARKLLTSFGVKIDSEDVGGNVGRNVSFDLETGIVNVTTRM
jgi:chemotaxis protein CheD